MMKLLLPPLAEVGGGSRERVRQRRVRFEDGERGGVKRGNWGEDRSGWEEFQGGEDRVGRLKENARIAVFKYKIS